MPEGAAGSIGPRGPLARRAAWAALVINLALAMLKGIAGVVFLSQALVADAVHSLGDAAGSFAVVYGVVVAQRPADERHRYGHAKAESLAGLAVAAVLAAAGVYIAVSAVGSILAGRPHSPDWAAALAAAVALLVKEALFRWNRRLGRQLHSPALLANAADHRSDEWTSLGAIAGVAGARLGFPLADPLAALLVAVLVLWSAMRLVRDNVDELLDLQADVATRQRVRAMAAAVPGVREVQRMRTRRSGPYVHIDMEIGVDGQLSLAEADRVAHAVINTLTALDLVQDAIVHVNPVDVADGIPSPR